MDLEALLTEPLDGRFRAFPDTGGSVTLQTAGEPGWHVLRDLPLPVLAIVDGAVEHNLQTMHGWCAERGVSLAPHGKTTMAPALIRRQLAAGAYGMTAASGFQAAVMAAAGARRVIVANELSGAAEIERVAALRREGVDVWALVDSRRGVELLDAALRERPADGRLPVLLEIGAPGSRAGARDDDEARAVAAAAAASEQLRLIGVEAWEGVLGGDRSEATLDAVDALCDRAVALTRSLDAAGAFADAREIVLTAGGSSFFDRVAERLRADGLTRPCRTILRSGCYLTHDHGHYDRLSPLRERLRPALRLYADVRSRPEPGLAIVGFGKRDAPYDIDLPTILEVVDHDGRRREPPTGARVASTNDQHAFVRFEDGDLAVGDVLVCGVSHPCTAFDKWPALPLIDDEERVLGAIRTVF